MVTSVASSHTLSSCDDFDLSDLSMIFPFEITEKILSEAIGRHVHDWFSFTITSKYTPITTFGPGLFNGFWKPIVDLAIVSSSFRAMVMRQVCIVFGVRPIETESLAGQVYARLRSLFHFSRAIWNGAMMEPPPSLESPLMRAYGHFVIAQKLHLQGCPLGFSVAGRQDPMQSLQKCSSDDLPIDLAGYLIDDIRRLEDHVQAL